MLIKAIIKLWQKPKKQHPVKICPICNGEGETYKTHLIYRGTFISVETPNTRKICNECKGKKFK